MDARTVEAHLDWYGGIGVNLTPREQIQTSVITGVILLLMGIIATVAALISTPDISQLLRIIGPSFVVIGVFIIAICRYCLKKMDAEDVKGDDVVLSLESQQPTSHPVK